jgi:predicted naringenin-chalcone synthase
MQLGSFRSVRPRYEFSQAKSLTWLTEAHVEAEAAAEDLNRDERHELGVLLARAFARCACPPTQISNRGASIADISSGTWDDRELYALREHPRGRGWSVRTRLFADVCDAYFAQAYGDDTVPPDELVHVTCTGYVAPSAAQKLVAQRRWPTRVTHAYHMGCYAAVPAMRIAAGAIALGARRVDVVHTELCSLHLDPSDHRLEQLVVQSLFADGFIRYAATPDDDGPGLRVLSLHEELVPDSEQAMGWQIGDAGMEMTLSRDVPARIATVVRGAVIELFRRGGHDLDRLRGAAVAVHPGGPAIIDRVCDALELDDAQVRTSRAVLFDHGNMSSATLPHVWMRMLADADIAPGTLIPSLAFGPGLTVAGALLEKRG